MTFRRPPRKMFPGPALPSLAETRDKELDAPGNSRRVLLRLMRVAHLGMSEAEARAAIAEMDSHQVAARVTALQQRFADEASVFARGEATGATLLQAFSDRDAQRFRRAGAEPPILPTVGDVLQMGGDAARQEIRLQIANTLNLPIQHITDDMVDRVQSQVAQHMRSADIAIPGGQNMRHAAQAFGIPTPAGMSPSVADRNAQALYDYLLSARGYAMPYHVAEQFITRDGMARVREAVERRESFTDGGVVWRHPEQVRAERNAVPNSWSFYDPQTGLRHRLAVHTDGRIVRTAENHEGLAVPPDRIGSLTSVQQQQMQGGAIPTMREERRYSDGLRIIMTRAEQPGRPIIDVQWVLER